MPKTPDRDSPQPRVPPELRRAMTRKMMHNMLDAGISAVEKRPTDPGVERLTLISLAAGFDAIRGSETNAPGVYPRRAGRQTVPPTAGLPPATGATAPQSLLSSSPLKVDDTLAKGWRDICMALGLEFSQARKKELYRLAKAGNLPIRIHGQRMHPTARVYELIPAWNRLQAETHER